VGVVIAAIIAAALIAFFSKKGYDFYMAKNAMQSGGLQNNPAFENNSLQVTANECDDCTRVVNGEVFDNFFPGENAKYGLPQVLSSLTRNEEKREIRIFKLMTVTLNSKQSEVCPVNEV
jgi:hypothetical protein